MNEPPVAKRNSETINTFVYKDVIVLQERGQHAGRGNNVGFEEGPTHKKRQENGDDKGAWPLKPKSSERTAGVFSQAHSLVFNLQDRQKRFLWNVDLTDRFHALFTFFLLLKEFSLSTYVTAVTLRRHVFS